MQNIINFLRLILLTFYDSKVYYKIVVQYQGFGIRYISSLLITIATILIVTINLKIQSELTNSNSEINYILHQVPEIIVTPSHFSSNIGPIIIKTLSGTNLLKIDTSIEFKNNNLGKEELNKAGALSLLTKNALLIDGTGFFY